MNYSEIDEQIPFANVKLTDLIEVETLQQIQDAFSKLTNMAALTADEDGVAVTRGSNFSRFCTEFCRSSEIGKKRCEQCDINGAREAMKKNAPVSYYCHANLIDFAAPIMLRGKILGSFIGGQVLPEPPDLAKMEKIADEIGVEKNAFLEAAKETNIVPKDAIDRATEFIYSFSQILSNIAYQAYAARYLSEKAKQASNAKSDFLATMSHEIRTPMNAVLGMANIALRENLPKTARESINQIVSSGKLLLAIINDILDYSKIEAGKMEISEEPYEILSVLNDLSNIFAQKIGEKNVEFIVDANPLLPRQFIGDCFRIKQVVTNLVNNAIKFTSEGMVCLHASFEKTDGFDDNGFEIVNLNFAIEDTGIGIKEKDKERLFVSFQQLDTKRNRNVEGTGLGLAISKNLLELMGGEISVQSEYGEGSTFSVSIPQKIKSASPCIELEGENFFCGIIVQNEFLKMQLKKDFSALAVKFIFLNDANCIQEIQEKNIKRVFVEESIFSQELQNYAARNEGFEIFVIASIASEAAYTMRNVRVLRKPVYVLSIASALKNISLETLLGETRGEDFYFSAPCAQVLIVDDNEVNASVAKGLLAPLKMQIDFAMSGLECLEKIAQKKYDLIFMDHMMPVLDGVETTILIRRDFPEYANVPIIALTANVLAETKNLFFQSGMNDFVGKPIELKVIVPKIKQWLPKEKIIVATKEEIFATQTELDKNENFAKIEIPGIDAKYAIGLLGSEKFFWEILEGWQNSLAKKIDLFEEYFSHSDWKSYTIEVHALKSSARQVGAIELSKLAENLEAAGKREDADFIKQNNAQMIFEAKKFLEILQPLFKKEAQAKKKPLPSQDFKNEKILLLKNAFENLDIGTAEEICAELEQFEFSESDQKFVLQILSAVENMDSESGLKIVEKWKNEN